MCTCVNVKFWNRCDGHKNQDFEVAAKNLKSQPRFWSRNDAFEVATMLLRAQPRVGVVFTDGHNEVMKKAFGFLEII